ncbi:MAG: S8 family serine peptidase [Vicinamibacterales bacterium]
MRLEPGTYSVDGLRPHTGQGVRIVVIDSGVHAWHPHVGGVQGGAGIGAGGERGPDFVDRLGHGTAVTAAIREKAPGAEILVARVFEDRLEATAAALVSAIGWGAEQGASIINLSLGTANAAHAGALSDAVRAAQAAGVMVVSAGEHEGVKWLPGTLPGVVAVEVDWRMARHRAVVEHRAGGATVVRASGYPRPIPGVPAERNLKGVSFAVANATGVLALLVEQSRANGS